MALGADHVVQPSSRQSWPPTLLTTPLFFPAGGRTLLGAGMVLLVIAAFSFLAVAWPLLGHVGQAGALLAATGLLVYLNKRFESLPSTSTALSVLVVAFTLVDAVAVHVFGLTGLESLGIGANWLLTSLVLSAV